MILILACGNELREDDGAGLVLAERLERAWRLQGHAVRRVAVQQLTPELATEVVQPEVTAVVFVDTRVADSTSAAAEVEIARLSPTAVAAPVVGHHLDPTVVSAYATVLTDQPLPPFWLVTVPGAAFGHGEGLSHSAQAAIERALAAEHDFLTKIVASAK